MGLLSANRPQVSGNIWTRQVVVEILTFGRVTSPCESAYERVRRTHLSRHFSGPINIWFAFKCVVRCRNKLETNESFGELWNYEVGVLSVSTSLRYERHGLFGLSHFVSGYGFSVIPLIEIILVLFSAQDVCSVNPYCKRTRPRKLRN